MDAGDDGQEYVLHDVLDVGVAAHRAVCQAADQWPMLLQQLIQDVPADHLRLLR